jgi:hypothetical protein
VRATPTPAGYAQAGRGTLDAPSAVSLPMKLRDLLENAVGAAVQAQRPHTRHSIVKLRGRITLAIQRRQRDCRGWSRTSTVGRCTRERRSIRSMGAVPVTFRVTARCRPGGLSMRKRLTIRLHVTVDVAACLRAIAVIIYLLMT